MHSEPASTISELWGASRIVANQVLEAGTCFPLVDTAKYYKHLSEKDFKYYGLARVNVNDTQFCSYLDEII